MQRVPQTLQHTRLVGRVCWFVFSCVIGSCAASGGDPAVIQTNGPAPVAADPNNPSGAPTAAPGDPLGNIADDLDGLAPPATDPCEAAPGDAGACNGGNPAGDVCGDGLVGSGEGCDDAPIGAGISDDGCSATCNIEPGFVCPIAGAACRAVCGDGLVRGREVCDPAAPFDASAEACDDNCRLRPGWVCPPEQACRRTACGDGVLEGTEQCDEGDVQPYDGCSVACTPEPRCGSTESAVGACVSTCGDGILLGSDQEACDDGNRVAGDGCDLNCQREPGYTCTTSVEEPPAFIDVPVVLRDFPIFQSFQGPGETNPIGHPDMNRLCCALMPGIVQPLLGRERKPVYAGTGDLNPINQTSGETYFNQWYRDVDGVNLRFDQSVRLLRQPNGAYALNSATDAPWAALGGFFPLENLGYGAENLGHNFFFTSELRYWFEYLGGEQLDFSGDDDVWVYINGRLAVDLGGVHNRTFARVTLGTDGTGLGCTGDGCVPNVLVDYGLALGNIYEVVVFQAERHPGDSNYFLTLANFRAGASQCESVCGDGFVTPDEACDLGPGNTGGYGGCNANCSLAPFCGDGRVAAEFGEQCDDRVNTSAYGGCAAGCVLGPSCGDGVVQPTFEQCEPGVGDSGGRCLDDCQLDDLR